MSFILDALKKSENDRQRQNGPALFEVRVAPPRSRFPMLAVIIVGLLVVNIGVVAWIMMRKPAAAATPLAPIASAAVPAATQPPINTQPNALPPAPSQGLPQMAQGMQPQPSGAPPAAYNGVPPPAPGTNNGYAQAGTAYPPPSNNAYAGAQPAYSQQPQNYGPPAQGGSYSAPNAAPSFGRAPNQDPNLAAQNAGPAQEPVNPDDYAPARDAPPPGFGAGRVIRGTESGLPSYEEAATHASIPPLHMDLHSYAADPTKRFVLINMKRLYEGQSLPEGPKVERITTDSAIMSYNGQQFVLDKN